MKRVIGLIGLICLVCNGVMGQTQLESESCFADNYYYSRLLSRSKPGINVGKFKLLKENSTTNLTKPKLYRNGKMYALIKVSIDWGRIDNKDQKLTFALASSEKVITDKNEDETIWLYVPSGTRQITISHKETKMQNNYSFPIRIENEAIYEMELFIEKKFPSMALFEIDSVSNADVNVYIDNEPIVTEGFGRMQGYSEIRKGKHNYRVEALGFVSKSDTFTIYDDFNNVFGVNMKLEKETNNSKRITAQQSISATPSVPPIAMTPPVVTIIPPAEYPNFSDTKLEIQYHIETAPNNLIKEVKVIVNGKIQPQARVVSKGRSVIVVLPKRDSYISITACNQSGWSEPKFLDLKWDNSKEMIIRPNLYVLAIGINNYDNIPPLKYAVKDMNDFVHAVQTKKMSPYEEIFVTKLSDKQATRQNIGKELILLSREAEDTDFTFIYFSGHGVMYKNSFYLASADADREFIPSTCIHIDEFSKYLGEIRGKVIVFIDACYSGSLAQYQKAVSIVDIDMQEIVSDMYQAKPGRYIYASSREDEVSNEHPEWRNGAFTEALIEAFNGKARTDNKKMLSTFDLMLYLKERMKKIIKTQKPYFNGWNEEFPLFTY